MEKAIAEALETNEAMSLMLTDIDHFKTFNDNFGHLTGDQVLRLVAMSVKHNVKGKDTTVREFAVILPNTILRAAVTVAEHIRRAVMAKELMKRSTGEHLGRMTISIGVATLRPVSPFRRKTAWPQPRDLRDRPRSRDGQCRGGRVADLSWRLSPALAAPIHRSRKRSSGSDC